MLFKLPSRQQLKNLMKLLFSNECPLEAGSKAGKLYISGQPYEQNYFFGYDSDMWNEGFWSIVRQNEWKKKVLLEREERQQRKESLFADGDLIEIGYDPPMLVHVNQTLRIIRNNPR